jgi:hypothetical protein
MLVNASLAALAIVLYFCSVPALVIIVLQSTALLLVTHLNPSDVSPQKTADSPQTIADSLQTTVDSPQTTADSPQKTGDEKSTQSDIITPQNTQLDTATDSALKTKLNEAAALIKKQQDLLVAVAIANLG